MRNREKHAREYEKYERYFESLGGIPITTPAIPAGTTAICRTFNLTEKYAFFQAFDPHLPFCQTLISTYSLDEIEALNPEYPDFWKSVAVDDRVTEVLYSQKKEESPFMPNIAIELPDEHTCRIRCMRPTNPLVLWPIALAEGAYAFSQIPKEIDRALRVTNNIYATRNRSPFQEANPAHFLYKEVFTAPTFAIEYKLDTPNRMHPVDID